MLRRGTDFWRQIKKDPKKFYVIHYSSESLFESEAVRASGAISPRITSIVVQHFASGQTVSFSFHLSAEQLGIEFNKIDENYNIIERDLLEKFYAWAKAHTDKTWIHWNMRNVTFGFEHLEHRYRVLTGGDPPGLPIEFRVNLNDELRDRFGPGFAPHPHMSSLMKMNGAVVQGFLTGKQEAEAFRCKEFIAMQASTIAKVGFFRYIINIASTGRLKTAESSVM
jgi:hypothetical protein